MSFKLPLDAFVLAVPLTYCCCALTALVYNTLRNDPEQSTISFYDNPDKELASARRYLENPAKRFFDARVTGRQTWGFFENDFSKQQH